MRSVSAARVIAFRWSCAPRCGGSIITYERTTIRICCKATWLNCCAALLGWARLPGFPPQAGGAPTSGRCAARIVAGRPPWRAFLQESKHALASLVGDEQSRRVGTELLGVAVKAVQDGGGGQCFRRGQPLRGGASDVGDERGHPGVDVV